MATQENQRQPKDDPRQAMESGEQKITGSPARPKTPQQGGSKGDPSNPGQAKIGEDLESGRQEAEE
ncbi:MAG TPA: hypothetical protein VF669_15415 [Tepidisphaeraceae bacterium]|jgi:hypothetical protein